MLKILLPILLIAAVVADNSGSLLPDCTKFMMKIAKKQLKLFGECSREMKAVTSDRKEFEKKIQCVVKCVLDKGEMLNDEKKVSRESMQRFMDENVPVVFHSVSHDFMEHCLEDYGPKMDDNEELCTAYGDFVKCVQNVVANIC